MVAQEMSTNLQHVSMEPESESDDDIPVKHSQQQQNASASASHKAVREILLYVEHNSPEMASISTMSMHASHAIIHRYVAGDESLASVKSFRLQAGRFYASWYRSSGYDDFFEMDLNTLTLHIPSKSIVVNMFRQLYLLRASRDQALPADGPS